jgi:hypothetical protein
VCDVIAALLAATLAAAAKLSDADLLAYARTSFDRREKSGRHEVLGRHRGVLVVVDYPCGDVCPNYTTRIIHYDVPVADCDRVAGRVIDRLLVRGPGLRHAAFCVPPVLAAPPAAAPAKPAGCPRGLTPRLAGLGDAVCVTAESRAKAQSENLHAGERKDPHGAYGPDSCRTGFVWRQTYRGDLVCVTPARRDEVRQENLAAAIHAGSGGHRRSGDDNRGGLR